MRLHFLIQEAVEMATTGPQVGVAGAERTITREELRKHDGIGLPSWVAVDGIVYDVGKSFQWIRGKHQELHFAGNELSSDLEDAPHGAEVFAKFPKVGRLLQ